jgi:Dolichyl-phosphate-mannose-protein mannosyltransferase
MQGLAPAAAPVATAATGAGEAPVLFTTMTGGGLLREPGCSTSQSTRSDPRFTPRQRLLRALALGAVGVDVLAVGETAPQRLCLARAMKGLQRRCDAFETVSVGFVQTCQQLPSCSFALLEPSLYNGRARSRLVMPGASRRWSLLLFLLLAWGLALRVWLATPDLTAGRFWDERYGIENLRALLQDGQLHPVKGFYPGLSYLPQALPLAAAGALYRLTGWRSCAVFDETGEMTPTGYLLCRLIQALAGTLSLYLTFRIGRRLFSSGVGLLAALLLASMPWHLRQSVEFKPDILLTAACLLAFERSLIAAENPDRKSFALAGSAIGLANACKLSAVPIAVPLMVAALAGARWRDWRSWGRLLWAGGASVAVFLFFTPYFALDFHFYWKQNGNTLRSYAQSAMSRGGSSHLSTLWTALGAPLGEGYHGPLIGSLALLGLAIWTVRAVRPPGPAVPRMQRFGAAMAASFVLAFILFYSIATSYPKANNWLPLAPFTSLAAAWVVAQAWKALASRLPFLRRRVAVVAMAGGFSLLFLAPATLNVYRNAVPTTLEVARRFLAGRLAPQPGRSFIFERGGAPAFRRPARSGTFFLPVERLDGFTPARLDAADAELFLAARLEDEGRRFYEQRLAAAHRNEAVHLAPALFRARGPELLLILHPWHLAGAWSLVRLEPQADRSRCFGRTPGGLRPGETFSLEVDLPRWRKPSLVRRILIDGQPVDWDVVGREGHRRRLFTQRFPVGDSGAAVTLLLGGPLRPGQAIDGRCYRWQR